MSNPAISILFYLPLLLWLELCDRFCNYPDLIIWSCLLSLNHSTSSKKHIWRVGAFNSDTNINLSWVGMPLDRTTTSDNSLTIIENRQSLITMRKSTIFIAIHSSISNNRMVFFPPLSLKCVWIRSMPEYNRNQGKNSNLICSVFKRKNINDLISEDYKNLSSPCMLNLRISYKMA